VLTVEVAIVTLLCVTPLLVFWFRMFQDMTGNIYLTDSERFVWLWAFILLNVVAAVVYYVNVYRPRP